MSRYLCNEHSFIQLSSDIYFCPTIFFYCLPFSELSSSSLERIHGQISFIFFRILNRSRVFPAQILADKTSMSNYHKGSQKARLFCGGGDLMTATSFGKQIRVKKTRCWLNTKKRDFLRKYWQIFSDSRIFNGVRV